MRLNLTRKLFLAMTLCAGAGLAAMAGLMYWRLGQDFRRYLGQVEAARLDAMIEPLQAEYRNHGSWAPLRQNPRRWRAMLRANALAGSGEEAADRPPRDRPPPRRPRDRRSDAPPRPRDGRPGPPPRRPRPDRPFRNADDPLDLGRRIVLYDREKRPVFGPPLEEANPLLRAIEVDGETAGWLGIVPLVRVEAEQAGFLRRQAYSFLLIALGVIALTAVAAAWLARHFLKPANALAHTARRLSAGDFEARAPVYSDDELGQLAHDFNSLAHTLARNETARRRWTADIAHELRTPLAILRGELEALRDGVRRYDPAALRSLLDETALLAKLVDDLRQLALADAGALQYRKTPHNPLESLDQSVRGFEGRFREAELTLRRDYDAALAIEAHADGERLRQLFGNLLENASRYTDAGGEVRVRAGLDDDGLTICVEDSAPAPAADDLAKLFDRFYRVETSRGRRHGGSGLGLAICKRIVEAHQGAIEARPSELGGLAVTVRLPLTRRP